ncbi:hypothetical protein OQA88_9362 [Cercophora sp. LCS_1]
MPFSFSFSSSFSAVAVSTSTSSNGNGVTQKGWAYKHESYSNNHGSGVRTTKQKLGEAPVTETKVFDAQGRPLIPHRNTMTTRILRSDWVETVIRRYEQDYMANWNKNIVIEIPIKIDARIVRGALIGAYFARRCENDPTYEDNFIKIRVHLPRFSVVRNGVPPQPDDDWLD